MSPKDVIQNKDLSTATEKNQTFEILEISIQNLVKLKTFRPKKRLITASFTLFY